MTVVPFVAAITGIDNRPTVYPPSPLKKERKKPNIFVVSLQGAGRMWLGEMFEHTDTHNTHAHSYIQKVLSNYGCPG